MDDVPVIETATEAPPAAPRFVSAAPRSEVVALDWPIEFEGKTYSGFTVRRLTGRDIADVYERVRAGGPDAPRRLPIIDAPDAVIDALDADDDAKVSEAVSRFLPRSFQLAPASEPIREDGAGSLSA